MSLDIGSQMEFSGESWSCLLFNAMQLQTFSSERKAYLHGREKGGSRLSWRHGDEQ